MLAMNCGIAVPSYTSYPAAEFKLPEKHDNMRRVYAYLLRQRGIDKDVLDAFTYVNRISHLIALFNNSELCHYIMAAKYLSSTFLLWQCQRLLLLIRALQQLQSHHQMR